MAARVFRSTWMRRLPLCGAAGAVACAGASRTSLEDELSKLRPNEAAMRAKWIEDDQESWRKLPPRAWPTYQPSSEEIPRLRAQIKEERCPSAGQAMSAGCLKLHFDLATALVFNNVDGPSGVTTFKQLGRAGNLDGMVATGVCLVEGLGVQRDDTEGVRWLKQASEKGSAQGLYELGTLVYVGTAGLEEDEQAAYSFFQQAAEQEHPAAIFMVADCLLEGVGCKQDQAKAVPLLRVAADLGHRGARQHLRQLLDGTWRGFMDQKSRPVDEGEMSWHGEDLPSSR